MPDGRKFCPKDCPRRAVGCRSDCPQWQEFEKLKQEDYAKRQLVIASKPSANMLNERIRRNQNDQKRGRKI